MKKHNLKKIRGSAIACLTYFFAICGAMFLDGNKLIYLSISLFFLVVGIGMVLGDILLRKRRKSICTESVKAKCIDEKKISVNEHWEFSSVFEYYYNGVEYSYTTDFDFAKVADVGEDYTLKVNPNNPADAWSPALNHAHIYSIAGFFCFVISSSCMILGQHMLLAFLLALVLFAVGARFSLSSIFLRKEKARIYTYPVKAKCIDIKVRAARNDGNYAERAHVFQYSFNGMDYIHTTDFDVIRSSKIEAVGEYYTLMIRFDDPADAWDPVNILFYAKVLWGSAFMLASILLVVSTIFFK